MDPPSLPSDVKHSYCAQTLYVFLFQNVFEENHLILCFAEGQPSMWNSNTREKPTNMCRRPTLPPRLWKHKEIKRNLIIICIVHFLNAKKCSINRIINGQDIFLPNFSSTQQADFYRGWILISWLVTWICQFHYKDKKRNTKEHSREICFNHPTYLILS